MNTRSAALTLLGATACAAHLFNGYAFGSLTAHPGGGLPVWLVCTVFAAGLALTLHLGFRGALVSAVAGFGALGLGFLAAGIVQRDVVGLIAGPVLVLVSMFVPWQFVRAGRRVGLSLLLGHGGGTTSDPAPERHTRLCDPHELDGRVLGLLEDTVHRYSLGDLRTLVRLCCETRYTYSGTVDRGRFDLAPVQLAVCVLTEKLVVLLIVDTDGQGFARVGRLAQTLVTDGSGVALLGPHVDVRSGWLGEAEASSHMFPLDGGAAGDRFVAGFRGLLATARHA
ncbi:hypothetical protein ACGFYY_30485 [Streptomyces sp. NPDC048331]|uniref:hypothetical protein n=1 Tax=Streptomyces sp. NPDC048331 TaxID=3365534 RepID=UPI0037234BF8